MAFAIAAIACKPEEKITPAVNVTSTPESLVLAVEGGSLDVAFNANVEWTAALDDASKTWCRISPASGAAGDAVIKLIAEENTTNENREAVITITAQTATAEVKVTQLQKDALVLDGTKEVEINGDAQQLKLKVNHNVALTVAIEGSWITEAATKGMETTELVFDVAENKGEAAAERTGKITISNGELQQEVTVTQAVWVERFNLLPASEDQAGYFTVEGGSLSFVVDANIEYTLAVEPEWLTVSKEGNTYTFTAPAYAEPSDRYGYIYVTKTGIDADADGKDDVLTYDLKQAGTSTLLWEKSSSAYSDFTLGAVACRLAYKDGMLLVSTGAEVHALNAATGEYVQKIALPEGFQAHSMVSDAEGNVLVAARCEWGDGTNVFTVFKVSSLEQITTPTPIIQYANNSIWGAIVGNLRVYGDVNGDALITAFCGTTNYALTWEVKAGVVGDAVFYQLPAREIWQPENGIIAPLGKTVADGMFYNGYGNSYAWAFCANAATDNTWNNVYSAFSTWESGPSAASVVEMGGKKYMACLEHSFFPHWASPTYVYILDVTTPATPSLYFNNGGFTSSMDAVAAVAGDVLLVPGENCMYLYAMCNGRGAIQAVSVPVK